MKTNYQKRLAGTLQPCREKKLLDFEAFFEVTEPLSKLDKPGREFFEYVCSLLISNKQLTTADLPAITRAAGIWEIFIQAQLACQKNGYYQETKSGYTAKNAHWQVLTDAEKLLTGFEKSFGLTILSRSKIDLQPIPRHNPNDKYFSSNNDDDFS